MTRVIAYAFDADIHCPACTRAAHDDGRLTLAGRPLIDRNGLPESLKDREGNWVSALFSTDELPAIRCASCAKEINP